MKNIKSLFLLYTFLLLTSISFVYSYQKYDFIDFYPTIIATKLYKSGNKDFIYRNIPYGNYRSEAWRNTEAELLQKGPEETNFVYFPFYLYGFLVLDSFFSFEQIKIIFLLLNILLLSIIISDKIYHLKKNIYVSFFFISLLCISDPIRDILILGQNIVFLYFLYILYYTSFLKKNEKRSILFFLLAILVKPWAMAFVLTPLLNKKYSIFIKQSLALIIFLLFQYIVEPELMVGFAKSLHLHSKLNILAYNNISISSFFERLLNVNFLLSHSVWESNSPGGISPTKYLSMLIAVLVLGLAFRSKRIKIKRIAVKITPILLLNIFWNHYILIYIDEFLKPGIQNEKIKNLFYFFLLISLNISKFGVEFLLDVLLNPIPNHSILLSLIICFQGIFLLYIYFYQFFLKSRSKQVQN